MLVLEIRPRFEDSVEMEQLKSNLRAGRHECQLYSHIHVPFLSCVISFIVLPTLPSQSSAVLLKFPNSKEGGREGGKLKDRKKTKQINFVSYLILV